MNNKLYVGNIPYSMTADELGKLFEPFGAIESAAVVSDRDSGRSRGFGFVEMATGEEAQGAIEKLNGTSIGGRNIVVNFARERPQGGGGPPRD